MWIVNVWLFLCFMFNPGVYKEMVREGAPCFAFVQSLGNQQVEATPMPICWYDPSNTNK